MRIQTKTTLGLALGAALISALCIVGTAWAGQPRGIALVEAVNVSAGTVTLLGEEYRVGRSTIFVGVDGKHASLEALRANPVDGGLVSERAVDAVAWEATETATGWTLTSLRVLEAMPD